VTKSRKLAARIGCLALGLELWTACGGGDKTRAPGASAGAPGESGGAPSSSGGTSGESGGAPGESGGAPGGGGRGGNGGSDAGQAGDGSSVGALQGEDDAPASAAIPHLAYVPRGEGFDREHPTLRGVPLSVDTLIATVEPSATVGSVNHALTALAAEIVGGIPGKAREAGGLLYLRIPSSDHATMEASLLTLRRDPAFGYVVQDSMLSGSAVSLSNRGAPPDWNWDAAPDGGNWGLELSRVPALWNLNSSVAKTFPTPITGVFDLGFATEHEDLDYLENRTPTAVGSHGTHVAGIIGAKFGNGVGVDGVNPFARLIVQSLTQFELFGETFAINGELVSVLEAMIRARRDLRVVNVSLRYGWEVDTSTSEDAQRLSNEGGGLVKTMLETLAADGIALPQIIVAAGNESDGAFGLQQAKFASPECNAALVHGVAPIIVVEAVGQDDAAPLGGASRAPFSNVGGHFSAPGTKILSTSTDAGGYAKEGGTSMATPFIAGLLGYLYALEPALPRPTLTTNAVFDLLFANKVEVTGDARARVDAFDAAVDVDRVIGTTSVAERLADLDDGSPDGNLRIDRDGAVVLEEDHDGDTARGDGRVNMADFRRFRDWYHQFERSADLDLDGGPEHAKRDLNGDGEVGSRQQESYPRGDLNGDGVIARSATRRMKGIFGDREVTDLEVMQRVFSDVDYAAADLPDLVLSGDIHVMADKCFAVEGAARVQTTFGLSGLDEILYLREQTSEDPELVVTVPAEVVPYTVELSVLDADGTVIAGANEEVTVTLCGDVYFEPDCGATSGGVTMPNDLGVMEANDGYLVELPVGFEANPTSEPLSLAVLLFASDADDIRVCSDQLQRSGTLLLRVLVAADGELEPGVYPLEAWTEDREQDVTLVPAVPGTSFVQVVEVFSDCSETESGTSCECPSSTLGFFPSGELLLREVSGALVGEISMGEGEVWQGSFQIPVCQRTLEQHLTVARNQLDCVP
jgi:subtilisin family serine protease